MHKELEIVHFLSCQDSFENDPLPLKFMSHSHDTNCSHLPPTSLVSPQSTKLHTTIFTDLTLTMNNPIRQATANEISSLLSQSQAPLQHSSAVANGSRKARILNGSAAEGFDKPKVHELFSRWLSMACLPFSGPPDCSHRDVHGNSGPQMTSIEHLFQPLFGVVIL